MVINFYLFQVRYIYIENNIVTEINEYKSENLSHYKLRRQSLHYITRLFFHAPHIELLLKKLSNYILTQKYCLV